MNISWLGHSCFRLSEKIEGQEVVVVTDPYGKETGLFPPKIKTDVVTVSHDAADHANLDKISGNLTDNFIVFDRPGEYETRGVYITSITTPLSSKQKVAVPNIVFKFDFNGVSVAHLGDINTKLTDEQLEDLGDVDILLIPVGGGETCDGSMAAEIVRAIEPRIVIPMHFKTDGVTWDVADEKKFLKEMGGTAAKEAKLKISRKDLPEDTTKIIILEKT
jgi:L-ascorbate metabolism protein UlaG (beta-lactamase superfamily)